MPARRTRTTRTAYKLLVVGGWNATPPPSGACPLPAEGGVEEAAPLQRGFLGATMSARFCDVTGLVNDVVQKL